ncbi:folliculin-interacting protein 2-like [Asterias rubens]|uniref:folliculin-interacting protein 2-like n=1 Tax=Asterias rubens TaxID=7604 RepID=UPI0014555BE2|nr:folliculin-interacting protein 2-like [Asterias rubens]
MALYRRIFPHKDKKCRNGRWTFRSHKKDYNFSSPELLTSHKSWQAPEFDKNQIRLLVFNEGDLKGRKLLFDSKAIKKNEQKVESSAGKGNQCRFSCSFGSKNNLSSSDNAHLQGSGVPGPNGDVNSKYTFLRPSSDVKLLGEMMYGSVAMSYRGSSVKVHTIKSPSELMLSQVFVLRPKENVDPERDNISLAPVDMMVPRSNKPTESSARSLPVAVPPAASCSTLDDDSGVASSSSSFLTPFPSPGSSVSSNQSNSLHRRWMRNQVTSMEHGVRRKSSETLLNVDEPMNRRRHPKIGVGVVVTLFDETELEKRRHFQTFFFSHFTLFEGHFLRMSSAVEKALTHQRRMFITPIMEALYEFRSSVYSLYCAPRIQRPIWLNMMTYQMQRGHLCEHLMHELHTELEIHNSKQTNFFFSRLLTAVLMHHLAWVPTVMPAEAAPSRAYLDKHSSILLDLLAKSHPYNPLWAQLGDMFGAIGYPCKVAKTVIVGRRADVVCRLLYILSYFIRCSEVHEIPEQREQIYMEYNNFDLQSLDMEEVHKTDVGGAPLDDDGSREVAITKSEGVMTLCDSADSGLESSLERLLDSQEVEEDDSNTGGKEDFTAMESIKTVGVSPLATESIGVTSGTISTKERPLSGSLYPDLQMILSDANGQQSRSLEAEPKQPEDLVQVPLIHTKDIEPACPWRERIAAVGMSAPAGLEFQDKGVGQIPEIYPRTFHELSLDSKLEYSVHVGRRSVGVEESTHHGFQDSSTKTTKEDFSLFKSGPGHDRPTLATATPITKQSSNGNTSPTNVQESTDSTCSGSTTPSDSSVDTDDSSTYHFETVSSQDSSSPSLRRHKRFPLTSPLARAHQEALFAQIRNEARSTVELKKPSENIPPERKDQKESVSLHATTRGQQISSPPITQYVDNQHEPSGRHDVLARPLSNEDTRGQQTTPVRRQTSQEKCRTYMRCFSTGSSVSSGYSDRTLIDHEELPMAFTEPVTPETDPGETYVDNFGRSLLGGYSQTYVPDMALHGVPELDKKQVLSDLVLASQNSVLDEAISEAVCIVADTDKWTVELLSSERTCQSPEKPLGLEVSVAECVHDLMESVCQMCHLRMPSDFCLMHLEDQLQEVYFKSTALAAYLDKNPRAGPKEMTAILGFEPSDLPLLLSVLSVHSPNVIKNVLWETLEKR